VPFSCLSIVAVRSYMYCASLSLFSVDQSALEIPFLSPVRPSWFGIGRLWAGSGLIMMVSLLLVWDWSPVGWAGLGWAYYDGLAS